MPGSSGLSTVWRAGLLCGALLQAGPAWSTGDWVTRMAGNGQALVFSAANPAAAQSSTGFWTVGRLALADPLDLPADAEGVEPFAAVGGQSYTSSRVFPDFRTSLGAGPAESANSYTRAGVLVFVTETGPSWCSASVIDRRLLVTAGHCVYDPDLRIFYTHFMFMPGVTPGMDGAGNPIRSAPYGAWDVVAGALPVEWLRGTAHGGYTADFAVLQTADSVHGGAIGQRVGHFHLATPAAVPDPASVTVLGYPGNLDSGLRMQQANGQTRRSVINGSPRQSIGSNFGGGSSGGPWLVDFGWSATGQASRTQPNGVVGVTSTGPDNNPPGVPGGPATPGTLRSSIITPSLITARDTLCRTNGAFDLNKCYATH